MLAIPADRRGFLNPESRFAISSARCRPQELQRFPTAEPARTGKMGENLSSNRTSILNAATIDGLKTDIRSDNSRVYL